jgi:general L-amino acid transport system permease protein
MNPNLVPPEKFRLGMLLGDTRYRSTTIQVFAFIVFVSVAFWLVDNTAKNLAALGKEIDFSYLSSRAGYDINQRLIHYTSDSSHARAAFVGILNTLLVAFFGCFIATVLGLFIGILRLSNNWIVARLTTIYIEGFRNIPVLLWIVMFFAFLTEMTPAPKAFKGADPSSTMIMFDSIAITNRGTYFPMPIFNDGSAYVLITFLLSLVIIGFFLVYARNLQRNSGKILPRFLISVVILCIPTLIIYFLSGSPVSLEYPYLKGFNFKEGIHVRNSFLALTLALGVYTSAYIAELVRSGIQAIPKGQKEAASALGLRPNRVMSLIILPQAIRIIVPPTISQFLNITKNSSLAIAVGYMDVRSTLGGITLNQTGREMESMLLLMIFYLIVSLGISSVIQGFNRAFEIKER